MGEFSITHWLIILAILLLFFGPSKLPGLGSSLGKAIRGFKAGLNDMDPNVDSKHPDIKDPHARAEQLQSASSVADKIKEKETQNRG